MIRLLNAHFPGRTLVLGFADACLVTTAFLATVARLGMTDAGVMLTDEQGILKIAVISVAFMTCMYFFDLYDTSVLSNPREILTRFIQVLGVVCILLAVLYYVYPPVELGRGIFLVGFVVMSVLLFLSRRIFLKLNFLPQFAERTLILGDGPLSEPLLHEFRSRPELGVRVVSPKLETTNGNGSSIAYESSSDEAANTVSVFEANLAHSVKTLQVDRIVISMGDRRGKLPVDLLLSLKSSGVVVQDGTDVYEAVTGKVPVESLRLGWLLFSPGFHVSRFLLIYKRVASIVVSSVGLILSLPLVPFIALVVRLTSPGPLLYRQKRVGRGGKVFSCYKVRTMRADAEADSGATWAADDDPRITKAGRFLRKSRIDEIPQLWNVFKGDMNLVGPRPERPEFVEWLSREIPHYQLRHTVRPGITGWAQIRYRYGNSVEDAKEKLRYDLFYVKNLSPGLDFLIFFETFKIILWGRGAK